jgi:hypothetical protein
MKVFTIAPEIVSGGTAPPNMEDPFFRIMLSLPPHLRQFACTSKYAEANRPLIDFLNQNKVIIKINSFDRLGADAVVYGGLSRLYQKHSQDIQQKMYDNGTQFLYYWDYREDPGVAEDTPRNGDFMFYPSETQMFLFFSGAKYNWVNGAAEAGINPHGAQAAAVGLVRSYPLTREAFLQKIGLENDKKALRLRLEEEMGIKLNPDLPILTHFMDHQLDPTNAAKGLVALSQKFNVLVKDLAWLWDNSDTKIYQEMLKGPNIYICQKHSGLLNNLMKFAADYLLLSCLSGTTVTAVMQGFKVIPIYTQHISYDARVTFSQRPPQTFTHQMRSINRALPLKIMDNISPLCIEATNMICERLGDEDYWHRYDEAMPEVQKSVFGRYLMDEAALKRIGAFVVRLVQTGTLVPDGADLRPIPHHPLHTAHAALL